jgi:three-Cys-motif partner protein
MSKDLIGVESSADGKVTMPVGPWAREKYNLLRTYTELFARGMKNKWAHRVYLDLFSGPGKVNIRGTGTVLLGSPLIAMSIPETRKV